MQGICRGDLFKPILLPGVPRREFTYDTDLFYPFVKESSAGSSCLVRINAADLDPALVKESSAWLAAQFQADAPRWGEQRLEVWQNYIDFVLKNNAIDKTIDPKAAFTNDFLPGK